MYIKRLKGNFIPFAFTCFLLVFTGLLFAQAPAGKTININIFGGTSPYNNAAWNNWNEPANKTSPVLKFADGVNSGVTITTSIVLGVSDNGTAYATTMCPREVGRFAMLSSTSAHTLTFANLKRDGSLYDLEIYASRNNTGNTTRFTVNGQIVNINTANNYSNAAQFTNLLPNASGQIVITITRAAGTYAYVNGLTLVEKSNIVNINPVANAGSNQSITLPTNSVLLTGSGTDADGTIASYQWTKIAGPAAFTIVSGTAAQTTVNNLAQGVYSFELRVTDNGTAIGRDTVQVTVNPAPIPNQPPVVDAGSNQTIILPLSAVALNGNSTDNDGTIASRIWTKISGPESYSISSPTTAQTTITGLTQGTYTFELAVTDDDGAIGKDIVTITVNPEPPNQTPIANAGSNQTITLPVNAVTLNGSGTDNDGTITSITWTKITGPEQYTITSAATAQTTVTGLTEGTYTFELAVTDDDGAVGKDIVTITVNPEPPNQAPTANAGSNQTITLPVNAVTLNGSGTDNDGTITSITWTKITGPEQYTITSAATAQTTVTGLTEGTYTFELAVTDDDGAVGKDIVTVTINPEPPNQAPTANAGSNQTITLPVNAVTLTGSGTDNDGTITSITWTKITGPEQYTITSAATAQTTVTGLTEGTYTFELAVTDDDGAVGKDIVTVTVNPEPPNQAPTANAGSNQTITLPVNEVTLTGSGTDIDGTIATITWTKLTGPEQYTITSAPTAQTTVTGLTEGTYTFELAVTDDDGAVGKDIVTVTVNPEPPNQAPSANAGSNQTITLPVSTVTLNGSGADGDGTIASFTWTKITGPEQYTITSAATAQTTVTGLTEGTYTFELAVTDDDGAVGKDIVTVTVNPEPPNQAPSANAGSNQTITLPVSTVTLNGSGADGDGTIASFTWTKITGPEQYSITSGSTSQTTVTGLTTGIYSFEFVVSDNDGATGKDTLIVTVNPAPPSNQLPVANAGTDKAIATPSNSITLVGSGTDADGTIASYQWTKISGPTQFSIGSPNAAQTNVTNLAQGVYGFALRVTDNQGAIGRDTVLVAVSVYVIPVTDAGAPQNITSPASSANISASFAFQGATLKNLRWSKAKVPGQSAKKVVWIGSSTLSGTGASVLDSAVVWRVGRYYTGLGIMSSWLNLGVSGANVFQGMPTGYVPKGSQLSPDVTHNVTYALNQGADVVVVGYPSNGYEGAQTITEIMFAYRTIYNTVVNAGKKCYIMTAQPRPAFGTTGRNLLKQIADSIIAQYPDNYIQGYYNLVQTGTHNLLYNSGDDIHLNNAGHRVLFNSVVARNIFETWTSSPSIIAAPTSASTGISNLGVGKHVFQVSVTDTHEQSANDTVTITVNPEPVVTANAGPDQSISLPVSSISLNGSGSMLGTSYLWRQLTGPSSTTIVSSSAANTNVSGLLTSGTYSFELALNGGVSKDTVYVFATIGSTDKVININIFGGSNPYNNAQWNNWNEPANRTSPVLKYADGVSSGVTITTSATFSVSDNGTSYPTTMCPREVGRYAMISSTGAHTLTFSNLKTDGTLYNLEIYASRNNTGNSTRFTVNGKVVDINTSSNYVNAARFTNLLPNASGQIVITITRAAGTYAYVNGLKLTEVVNLIVSN